MGVGGHRETAPRSRTGLLELEGDKGGTCRATSRWDVLEDVDRLTISIHHGLNQ